MVVVIRQVKEYRNLGGKRDCKCDQDCVKYQVRRAPGEHDEKKIRQRGRAEFPLTCR